MTEIYRVKIKRDRSFEEVGRIVLNDNGTGFCVLDILPMKVLYIERKMTRSPMCDSSTAQGSLQDRVNSVDLLPPDGEPEE